MYLRMRAYTYIMGSEAMLNSTRWLDQGSDTDDGLEVTQTNTADQAGFATWQKWTIYIYYIYIYICSDFNSYLMILQWGLMGFL